MVPDHQLFKPEVLHRAPLVIVHGNSRTAGRYFRAFLPAAIRHEVPLIVPSFDSPEFAGYQRLAGRAGPTASHDAMNNLLDSVAKLWDYDGPFDLFGYSGGAQFVHRFTLASPDRVRRQVVAASGWYTWLDHRRPYPYGLADFAGDSELTPHVPDFLMRPLLVLIGDRDTAVDDTLRTTRRADRQGSNRLERALNWIDHLETRARRSDLLHQAWFDLLPGAGHSFRQALDAGLVERTLAFLIAQRPQPLTDTVQTGEWHTGDWR